MTSNTPENFDALVAQAQIAHRLVVGFYQRLLPTIQQVADALELTFWEWEPYVTSRPCRKGQNPAGRWAWDMAPLMASNHYYWRTNGETAELGDAVLNLYVSFDSHFSNDDWEQWGIADGEEPDATQLPMGSAIVEIYLSRCDKRSDDSLEKLWNQSGEMEDEENNIGCWQAISPHLNAVYLKKSLADFIASPQDTIAQLRSLLDESIS
jgi:hypothetical protein